MCHHTKSLEHFYSYDFVCFLYSQLKKVKERMKFLIENQFVGYLQTHTHYDGKNIFIQHLSNSCRNTCNVFNIYFSTCVAKSSVEIICVWLPQNYLNFNRLTLVTILRVQVNILSTTYSENDSCSQMYILL